jgi:hypothetical protein
MAAGTKVQERVRREAARASVEPRPRDEQQDDKHDAAEGSEGPDPILGNDDDRAEGDQPWRDEPVAQVVHLPRLPQRTTVADPDQLTRVAVLVDARRVSAEAATGLLSLVGERGLLSVCRAYADWSRSDLSEWVVSLRQHGLHSFHQYADEDDQALVAMAIDAVDIARDASVDEVVIAGDLTSSLPLIHRLHAAGVRVVAVGAGFTPHDVRAASDEFLDTAEVSGERVIPAGRHRA